MRALIFQPPRSLPVWWSAAVWLAVYLSPTGYFLLLMIADRWHVPAPPEAVVVSLFVLIPLVALMVCGCAVWQSKRDLRRRVIGLILTVLGMVLQMGVLLVIIVSAITVAISPAQ
jgi:hypothetical protein